MNEHQIIVDIVAFVNRGDFPRSRLGEKQRGKILAGWVSRKMRTMAQFAIKDMDAGALGPPGPSAVEPSVQGAPDAPDNAINRTSQGSFRNSGGYGGPMPGANSNLRNVEHAPQILEQRELEQQLEAMAELPPHRELEFAPVEMPADERVRLELGDDDAAVANEGDQQTPTRAQHRTSVAPPPHGYDMPDFNAFSVDTTPPSLRPGGRAPVGPPATNDPTLAAQQQQPPQIRLPAIDGRESMDDWSRLSSDGTGGHAGREDDDWTKDAYMSMNLAGTLGRKES